MLIGIAPCTVKGADPYADHGGKELAVEGPVNTLIRPKIRKWNNESLFV